MSAGLNLVRVFYRYPDKKVREFVSYRGGPVEVYDFPKSWKGVSRQIGYLDAKSREKLVETLIRDFPLQCMEAGAKILKAQGWKVEGLTPKLFVPYFGGGKAMVGTRPFQDWI